MKGLREKDPITMKILKHLFSNKSWYCIECLEVWNNVTNQQTPNDKQNDNPTDEMPGTEHQIRQITTIYLYLIGIYRGKYIPTGIRMILRQRTDSETLVKFMR